MADEILTVARAPEGGREDGPHDSAEVAQKSELPCSKVRGQRFRRQYLDSWMASQVSPVAPEQPEAKPKAANRKGGTRR